MMNNENEEDELLYAKIEDKIKLSKTRNKILYTDFLNKTEQVKIEKYLKSKAFNNYLFNGLIENSERNLLIVYPEKLNENMVKNNFKNIFSCIRIILPNELKGKYEHRDFLSGLMKLGITREKIGDIIIYESGADIIILKENENYLCENLKTLTRFRKSEITIIPIDLVKEKIEKFEEISIIVSSMRIDNFVSELGKTSRNKAEELIKFGNVFLNYELVEKASKIVKVGDILTIRRKGKFIIEEELRQTKSDKKVMKIKKYA